LMPCSYEYLQNLRIIFRTITMQITITEPTNCQGLFFRWGTNGWSLWVCWFCRKKIRGLTILDTSINACYQSSVDETILRRDLLESPPIHVIFLIKEYLNHVAGTWSEKIWIMIEMKRNQRKQSHLRRPTVA
jgi:hypothetical protein